MLYNGCSFKFLLKVGVEESIVNAPLASLQTTQTADPWSVIRSHRGVWNKLRRNFAQSQNIIILKMSLLILQ
jgi:hypothetical protein